MACCWMLLSGRHSHRVVGALLLACVLSGNARSEVRAAPQGKPLIPRNAGPWIHGWSGLRAQVQAPAKVQTPDGEVAFSVTWTRTADQTLPNLGRTFSPTSLTGDVVAFWMRIDHPVEKIQVYLTDADDVGAEQGVHTLLKTKVIEWNRWHFVVWPMRTDPGWVRYTRGRVDWKRIKAISFYTWNEQIPPTLTMEVGPFRVMSFRDLETVFQRSPDRVQNNRSIPWRVLRQERPDRMMADYYVRRASDKVVTLRQKYPAKEFLRVADRVRADLARTYLMPTRNDPPPATLLRTVEVDGIRVQHQLLKTAEGVYSTALVYLPPDQPAGQEPLRRKALLMLPGHGDPNWPASVQSRCLSFVKQGYVVMFVQPMGQCERGEEQTWVESHDTRAMAFLLTAGESLLGLIMADHRSELSYLISRPDVDPNKIAVTGVSMGGTHTLWLSAIDTRVKGAIAVAAAPLYQPERCFLHHGLCDVMPGVFNVADGEMISALSEPRALLHIYPSSERPVSDAAFKRSQEGWLAQAELMAKHFLNASQLMELHRYVHDAYAAAKAPDRYSSIVVEGPHDYTQSMREIAAGWLAHAFDGRKSIAPIPEVPLTPITDRQRAISTLNFWPQTTRPRDMLAPTDYVRRRISAQIDKLPAPPKKLEDWAKRKDSLRSEVAKLLGSRSPVIKPKDRLIGTVKADKSPVQQWVVEPEPGIEIPMLMFAPDEGSKPDGRMVVLLHPEGMGKTTSSGARTELTRKGSWVLCVDLRGMGETRSIHESSGYMGFRDMDTSVTAIKLGDTLAGYWTSDLRAAIQSARKAIGTKVRVIVRGELETGLVAILAAGQDESIDGVETHGLLASCFSRYGYGLPFAYNDDKGTKDIRSRKLGGYGSMLPCIPHLLSSADIPQLMALVAPRPLEIDEPLWASGDPVAQDELDPAFAWARQVYRVHKAEGSLRVKAAAVSQSK